uniref:ATP-dependent DNA helicase n=1 Tax=Strongyloides papillosus TaxID=174720 RepID=A0A0N5BCB0_STREA
MEDNFELSASEKTRQIKRMIRCRRRIRNKTLEATRIIKLCDFFNIAIPTNINNYELKRKYFEVNQFYNEHLSFLNIITDADCENFRRFIERVILYESNEDHILNNEIIPVVEGIEEHNINHELFDVENRNIDNLDIEIDEGHLEMINFVDDPNNQDVIGQSFENENRFSDIETISIDDEMLLNQNNSDENNIDPFGDGDINYDNIYEIDSDVYDDIYDEDINNIIENLENNPNIDNIENSSNRLNEFIPISHANLNIDYIVENTYGYSEELNRYIINNEISSMFIEQENAENDIINAENSTQSLNEQQYERSDNKRGKKEDEYKEKLESDFNEYNFLNYFNLKKDTELCAVQFIIDKSKDLAEEMRNYDIDVPKISRLPKILLNHDAERKRYSTVRSKTLDQSKFIGINICKNAPVPFTMDNTDMEEDPYGYLNRLFGGYRYHLYTKSQDIKEFELIYIIFAVVSRIFRSPSQYSYQISYYNDVLKKLLDVLPNEKRKEDIKQLISDVLSSNIGGQLSANNIINVMDDEIIMNDIRDGYEVPLHEMTSEQQQLIKYTTLARCCDERCKDINIVDHLEDIIAIFIAFQRPENNIKTIYKITKYIKDKEILTHLNRLGKCFSRIRGLVMRIKEIIYQLDWLVKVNRLIEYRDDPVLKNFKGFNPTLKAIVVEQMPMRSNEINIDQYRDVIQNVRDEISQIKLRMCIICERINISNMKKLKKDKKIYRRIMNIINTPDNSIDSSTIETAVDLYSKVDNNHPFLNKDEIYLCNDCYNGTIEKNLENNPLGITKYSIRNGLYCDKIPDIIASLNQFERLILQKRWIIQSVFAINNVNSNLRSKMHCISGYSISIKVNSQKSYNDLLTFGRRQIIIINKSQYKIRAHNLVDLKKVYNAYKWFIENNPLYKDDVLPTMEEFNDNFVEPQFVYVDDVSEKRKEIIDNLSREDKKNLNRRVKRRIENNEADPYDNELMFKLVGYITRTEFDSFLLESAYDGDENVDPIAVFTKEHLKIKWSDSELDMSKKMFEAFPHIFPYARFGSDFPRRIALTDKEFLKVLMSKAQRRFSKESQLIMALSKTEQKKDAVNCIRMIGNLKIGESMTIEESLAKSREGKLMRAFRKLKISDSYWYDVTRRLNVIETYIGSPTWFLTLNPSEHQWKELEEAYKLLHVDENISFNLKRSIEEDPFVLNLIFEKRLEIILEHLKSTESVLGRVIFYYYKIEYQQRGTPHVHMLLWTDEGMNLDYKDKGKVVEFLDKYITTSLYTSLDDPDFTEQIMKEQKHVCRLHYCRKRRLNKKAKNLNSNKIECYTSRCRFGFPKKPSHKTKILNLSEDIESLLEISRKTQKSYVLRRMENETEINQYNPHVKMMWIGNIDLQPNALNFSCSGAVNYASKYVSKSTLSNNEKVAEYLDTAMKSGNKNVSSKLFHLMYGMHLRPQAYTEVVDIARSAKSHYTSINVITVNTSDANNRTRHLYKDKRTENVKAATNMYDNYYFSRPPLLEDTCLFSFFANFTPRRVTSTCKLRYMDDFGYSMFLLSFDELDSNLKEKYFSGFSSDKYGNIYNYVTKNWTKRHISSPCFEFWREMSIPIGTTEGELANPQIHLVPHKISLIDFFQFMGITEEDDHEYFNQEAEKDIYARYCRLFLPRRREIDHNEEDCKKLFSDYMKEMKGKYRQTYNDINTLIKICNSFIKKNLASKEFSLYKKELYERYKEILDFDGRNFQRLQACNDGFTDPVAKFGDAQGLHRAVSKLNNQQYLIYEKLYDKSMERYESVKRGLDFVPTRILCDGPGGTGKSFLIDVLAASITATIRNKMDTLEYKNQPFILKVCPTGVASVNIKGRTIHSLFSLPVSKSRFKMKLRPLNTTAKSKLSEILRNVQLLIIDEISMVDASMLYSINYRINEALNCDGGTLFGNLNCLFTGDLLQLPPVKKTSKDAQMFYEEINSSMFEAQFKSIIGERSAFIDFNFIPLHENNRQKADPTYALALNEIRRGNITDDFISIINSRTFKNLNIVQLYFKAIGEGHSDPVILTTRNEDVNFINDQVVLEYAKRNDSTLYIIHCNDTAMDDKCHYKKVWLRKENRITEAPILDVTLDSLEELLIAYEKKSKRNESGLHEKINLCRGATVMITRNLDLDHSVCNGARGVVEDIVLNCDFDPEKKLKANNISEVKVRLYETNRIVSIPPSWHYFVCGKYLMRRLQLPITLAYCTTVHKSQGLTLSSTIVHFPVHEDNKISRTAGLLYVALSRVKHSSGLYIKDLDYESYNIPNEKSISVIQDWMSLNPNDLINYISYSNTTNNDVIDNNVNNVNY